MEYRGNHSRDLSNSTAILVPIMLAVVIVILLLCALTIVHTSQQYNAQYYNELLTVMQTFHTNPNIHDANEIFDAKDQLIYAYGGHIWHWLWGVKQTHPTYFSASQKRDIDWWQYMITWDIDQARNKPTRPVLRCIWYIYFATGDQQYAEIVRRATTHSDPAVSSYARNTYEKIMKRDYKDPIMGTALDIDITADTTHITRADSKPADSPIKPEPIVEP